MEPRSGEIPTPRQFDSQISELVGTFQSLKESHHGSTYNSTTGRFVHIKREAGTGEYVAEEAPVDDKRKKQALAESKSFLRDIEAVRTKLLPLTSHLTNPKLVKDLQVQDTALLNSRVAQLKKAIEDAEASLESLPKEFPGHEDKLQEPLKSFITEAKKEVGAAQQLIAVSSRVKIQEVLNDLHRFGPKEGDDADTVNARNTYQQKYKKVRDLQALHKTRIDQKQKLLEVCSTDLKFFSNILPKIKEKDQAACNNLLMERVKEFKRHHDENGQKITALGTQINKVKLDIQQEEARLSPEVDDLQRKLAKLEALYEPHRNLDLRIENAKRRDDKAELEKLNADAVKDKDRSAALKESLLQIREKLEKATVKVQSPALASLEEQRVTLDKTLAQERQVHDRLKSRSLADNQLIDHIVTSNFAYASAHVLANTRAASEAAELHNADLNESRQAYEYYTNLVTLTNNIGNNLDNWLKINSGQNINALDYGSILNLLRAREFFIRPVREI